MKEMKESVLESDYLEFSEKIRNRVKIFLKKNGIRQSYFAELCGISGSYFSKLLNGINPLSFKDVYLFARIMKVELSELLSSEKNELDEAVMLPRKAICHLKHETEIGFITNPHSKYFKNILGEYFFYAHPTDKNDKCKFLKSKFTLGEHDGGEEYCESILELNTGKNDPHTNKPIIKIYRGRVYISIENNSCFTMMFSEENSDFCCLNWIHIHLNSSKLQCRMVSCLTSSSGVSNCRRPIMIKAIMSKYELSDEHLDNLSGQFMMNSASISMKKETFDKVIISAIDDKRIVAKLKKAAEKEAIYTWNEKDILDFDKKIPEVDCMELINVLRKNSNSRLYTKISSYGDSLIYEYICNHVIEHEGDKDNSIMEKDNVADDF